MAEISYSYPIEKKLQKSLTYLEFKPIKSHLIHINLQQNEQLVQSISLQLAKKRETGNLIDFPVIITNNSIPVLLQI